MQCWGILVSQSICCLKSVSSVHTCPPLCVPSSHCFMFIHSDADFPQCLDSGINHASCDSVPRCQRVAVQCQANQCDCGSSGLRLRFPVGRLHPADGLKCSELRFSDVSTPSGAATPAEMLNQSRADFKMKTPLNSQPPDSFWNILKQLHFHVKSVKKKKKKSAQAQCLTSLELSFTIQLLEDQKKKENEIPACYFNHLSFLIRRTVDYYNTLNQHRN